MSRQVFVVCDVPVDDDDYPTSHRIVAIYTDAEQVKEHLKSNGTPRERLVVESYHLNRVGQLFGEWSNWR